MNIEYVAPKLAKDRYIIIPQEYLKARHIT
jgi:hypothetical protein